MKLVEKDIRVQIRLICHFISVLQFLFATTSDVVRLRVESSSLARVQQELLVDVIVDELLRLFCFPFCVPIVALPHI